MLLWEDFGASQPHDHSRCDNWIEQWPDIQTISFQYSPNPLDGIDSFGHLLRYHIRHCMPHDSQWLVRSLLHERKMESATFIDLLMHDSFIMPAAHRLSDRIRKHISSNKQAIYQEYLLCETDGQITELLKSECKKGDLHFRLSNSIHEELCNDDINERGYSFMSDVYERYPHLLMEYLLKELQFQDCEEKLYQRAEILFEHLLLPDVHLNPNHD